MFFLFTLSPFGFPPCVLAQNYTVSFENGLIDWSNGIIEAVGIGSPPVSADNLAQARALAKRAAVEAARDNLIKIFKGIRINSHVFIEDFVSEGGRVGREILGVLQNSQAVDILYLPKLVEATVAVELKGPIADILLPDSIRNIPSVQQPHRPIQSTEAPYTGLLVDARGLDIKPAMAPRIVDEEGKEVYGSQYINRAYAVRYGVAAYIRGIKGAETNHRVADNPLVVKGIRPVRRGLSDIIVSNDDASCIRGTASNLGFLNRCRVLIVLD